MIRRSAGRFALALLVATLASTATARERSVFEKSIPTAGERLTLDLETGGSVELRGWDEERVEVRGHLGGRDWRNTRVDFISALTRAYESITRASLDRQRRTLAEVRAHLSASTRSGLGLSSGRGRYRGCERGNSLPVSLTQFHCPIFKPCGRVLRLTVNHALPLVFWNRKTCVRVV